MDYHYFPAHNSLICLSLSAECSKPVGLLQGQGQRPGWVAGRPYLPARFVRCSICRCVFACNPALLPALPAAGLDLVQACTHSQLVGFPWEHTH